jgi:catechol 2,3-dioxygenase-like lactoylglutathione lyase family enzyme
MLQHVTIEVAADRLDACVRFYARLGFERVEPPPSLGGRAVWVEGAAGTQVHLMPVDDPVVPPQGHHALLVEDYAAALDALREAGFDPEPREEHWGSPRAFVRNPAGHRVELMAGSPARR